MTNASSNHKEKDRRQKTLLKKKSWYVALIVLAIVISFFIFNNSRMPLIWISGIWILVALYSILRSQITFIKMVWVSIGLLILTFGAYETYLWAKNSRVRNLRYVDTYTIIREKPRGYIPQSNTTPSDKAYWHDESIYDVTYTINTHGLRVVPLPSGHDPHAKADSVLFFGGSMAFGQGVNDDETLPYFIGNLSGGKYRSYNLAFSGYGAHQMLAILEHKLEARIVDGKPKFGIYLAIIDHINRARGRAFWDQSGPRYVLGQDGQARSSGYFDDNVVLNVKTRLREKSLIFRRIFYKKITKDDIDLFLGIVDKTRQIFENRYPGSQFHVILWDRKEWGWDTVSEIVQKELRKRNVRFHPIRTILPEFDTNLHKYTLHQHEPHPNPLTHKLMAEYVINNVLGK